MRHFGFCIHIGFAGMAWLGSALVACSSSPSSMATLDGSTTTGGDASSNTGADADASATKPDAREGTASQAVVVSYAFTADGAIMPGGTSRWGHLRDSDPFVGGATTMTAQPNYGASFQMSAQ